MSDTSSAKLLSGDMLSSSSTNAEIPLDNPTNDAKPSTTSDNNSQSPWTLSNLQKLNVGELYTRQRQSLRSWTDFFNTSQFKPPANIKAGGRRVLLNVEYYQTNYILVTVILSIYCVITTPALLFVLLAMGAGCYLVNLKNRESQLVIKGRQISLTQQYIAVMCLCIPMLIIVGASSAIFWILGASLVVIFVHALFHQTPNQEAFGVQMEEV